MCLSVSVVVSWGPVPVGVVNDKNSTVISVLSLWACVKLPVGL